LITPTKQRYYVHNAKAKWAAKERAKYVIPAGFEFDFSKELKENDSWRNFSSRVWHKTRAQLTELGLDDEDAKRGAGQMNWWMAKPWFDKRKKERLEKPLSCRG